MRAFVDGDAVCIVEDGFTNLQECDATFIPIAQLGDIVAQAFNAAIGQLQTSRTVMDSRWQTAWREEHDARVRLEERLKLADMTIAALQDAQEGGD